MACIHTVDSTVSFWCVVGGCVVVVRIGNQSHFHNPELVCHAYVHYIV